MYSKNLYLIITDYSMMILHLRQRNLVAQYPLSKRKYPLLLKVVVPGGKTVLSIDKQFFWPNPPAINLESCWITATDSGPHTRVCFSVVKTFFLPNTVNLSVSRGFILQWLLVLKIQRLLFKMVANAIYGATVVTPMLPPFGKINKHTFTLIHNLTQISITAQFIISARYL